MWMCFNSGKWTRHIYLSIVIYAYVIKQLYCYVCGLPPQITLFLNRYVWESACVYVWGQKQLCPFQLMNSVRLHTDTPLQSTVDNLYHLTRVHPLDIALTWGPLPVKKKRIEKGHMILFGVRCENHPLTLLLIGIMCRKERKS